MARRVRIALLVTSHVLIGAVAALAGLLYVQHRAEQTDAAASRMVVITGYESAVELQRSKAPAEARDALFAFLGAIDQVRQQNHPVYNDTTYWTDKTLAYVRLARLEQSVGNLETANEYLGNAITASTKIAWKDCTAAGLIAVSENLEEQSRFLFSARRKEAAANPNQPAPPDGGHDVPRYD